MSSWNGGLCLAVSELWRWSFDWLTLDLVPRQHNTTACQWLICRSGRSLSPVNGQSIAGRSFCWPSVWPTLTAGWTVFILKSFYLYIKSDFQLRFRSVGHPLDIPPLAYSPRTFPPPRQYPSPCRTFPSADKANIWKLTPTISPDPNRSTAINFVHINGRSLYIVHWRMVLEGGNVRISAFVTLLTLTYWYSEYHVCRRNKRHLTEAFLYLLLYYHSHAVFIDDWRSIRCI